MTNRTMIYRANKPSETRPPRCSSTAAYVPSRTRLPQGRRLCPRARTVLAALRNSPGDITSALALDLSDEKGRMACSTKYASARHDPAVSAARAKWRGYFLHIVPLRLCASAPTPSPWHFEAGGKHTGARTACLSYARMITVSLREPRQLHW